MALSEYEKRVLEQMEAEFRRADPDLVSEMTQPISDEPEGGAYSPRSIAIGVLVAVGGLGVLIGAVSLGYSLWSILLGVVAFVLMVGGVWFALSSPKAPSSGPASLKKKSSGSLWARFIEGQERRWQERRRED